MMYGVSEATESSGGEGAEPMIRKERSGLRIIVLQLGEVAEIEAQLFSFAQKFNRRTELDFSTKPAILPNCCYVLPFLSVILKLSLLSKITLASESSALFCSINDFSFSCWSISSKQTGFLLGGISEIL